MAQTIDKGLGCSISLQIPAGPSKVGSSGRVFLSSSNQLRVARKIGVARSAQSDVQTKESVRVTRRAENGSTLPRRGEIGEGVVSLQGKITIRKKRRPESDERMVERMDVVADGLGENITIQLISSDADPVTGKGKRSPEAAIKDWAEKASVVADKVQYTADFFIDKNFGVPGALVISNKHQNEFFLESISLHGLPSGTIHFPTHAWVHSKQNNPRPRVFFSNQVYLPSATPKGLRELRDEDLKEYRGDGKGVRKEWENVYDYDVYNDLSDVDKDKGLARPILGGSEEHKYPRRTRTGRPPSKTDPSLESRMPGQSVPYVPRDENFEPIKQDNYFSNVIRGLVQKAVPDLRDHFRGSPDEFDSFDEIDQLYAEGLMIKTKLDAVQNAIETIRELPMFPMLPDIVQAVAQAANDQPSNIFRYPRPQILSADRFAWIRDYEFGRQTLAGLNPCSIERLKVFPPVSALDDVELYGPKESAITEKHISGRLNGMSVEEALKLGRLFIVDYHDIFMPFIDRINALGGRKGYASRTIFFLTAVGTLTPLAIELSLPSPNLLRQVFVPGSSSTQQWLWKLAKAHVGCNDAGIHQLASHWVRTHACVEPYAIATNRQLSPLHPVFKLLHPHFRYTMEINAAARQSLICAEGVIEKSFLPGRYAMEMSSVFYGMKWRFDQEGLPQELIARGVAVEDENSPSGVKLLIEDYPFASDGLLIWGAIESWVTDYISIYYKNAASVQQDRELQKWWEEIRTRGHEDKKDEEWWPVLDTEQDLVRVLTTMMWVTSGLHAAVNFGQFDYAGYVPNKPTLMRRHIPNPSSPEYKEFLTNPQLFFLSSLPSQLQSTVLMAVVESLSTHSPDEEYLGSDTYPKWFGCPEAEIAFRRFQERMIANELEIKNRNANPELRNRNGAGILPYNLLLPWSKPGITGQGIPNSISI